MKYLTLFSSYIPRALLIRGMVIGLLHWTQVKVARQKSRPWRANLRAHFAPPPARSAPHQTRTSRSTVLGQRTGAGARPRQAQECRKSGSGAALTGPIPSLTGVRWFKLSHGHDDRRLLRCTIERRSSEATTATTQLLQIGEDPVGNDAERRASP